VFDNYQPIACGVGQL